MISVKSGGDSSGVVQCGGIVVKDVVVIIINMTRGFAEQFGPGSRVEVRYGVRV